MTFAEARADRAGWSGGRGAKGVDELMAKKHGWQVGERCLVIPDRSLPERRCDGVVLSIEPHRGGPDLVRCENDPVWAGAVLRVRGRRHEAKVLPI